MNAYLTVFSSQHSGCPKVEKAWALLQKRIAKKPY